MLSVKRQSILILLEGLHALVDRYNTSDPMFVGRSLDWLRGGSDELQRVRMPMSSQLATARGRIIAVRDGLRPAGMIAPDTPARKAVRAVCADELADVERALRHAVEVIDAQLEDGRTKMSQLVAVSHVKSPIDPLPDVADRTAELRKIWATLTLSPETANMYAYLNASLRLVDRLFLLDEIVDNLTATDAERRAGMNGNGAKRPPAIPPGLPPSGVVIDPGGGSAGG